MRALEGVVREGLSEVAGKLRELGPEGCEAAKQGVPGGGNSKCRGAEVGLSLGVCEELREGQGGWSKVRGGRSDGEVGRREGTSEGPGCHPGALNRERDD